MKITLNPDYVLKRDIIKVYGADKWYYPDINCPKLKFFNEKSVNSKNIIR